MNLMDVPADLADLEQAVGLLTGVPVIVKLSGALGSTLESGMKKLPEKARLAIDKAAETGLTKALEVAGKSLDQGVQEARTKSHTAAVAATGLVGGFFGMAGLTVEIPVTTTVMMRSILDIARSEGHNISDPAIRMECLSVFSYGSTATAADDEVDLGYYAGRAALAEMIGVAAQSLAKSIAEEAAKTISARKAGEWLAKLIQAIAVRFGVVLTEKAVLQAAPIAGALTGATLNGLFMDYYQDVARGHFIVLRLEKVYGAAAVEAAFTAIQQRKLGAAG